MAAATILKNKKSSYLGRSFSDFNGIWQGDAVRPLWPFGLLQVWNLKISKMAAADVLKIKITIMSATVWPIDTAFGKVTHIAPANQTAVEILNF